MTLNYNAKNLLNIKKIKQIFHAYMPLFLMIILYFAGKITLSIIIPMIYLGIVSYVYLSKMEREGQNYDLYFSNTAIVAFILALHANV